MDRLKHVDNLDNLALVLYEKDNLKLEQWPIEDTLGSNVVASAALTSRSGRRVLWPTSSSASPTCWVTSPRLWFWPPALRSPKSRPATEWLWSRPSRARSASSVAPGATTCAPSPTNSRTGCRPPMAVCAATTRTGPTSATAFLCAKAFGATKVFITDINESRLNLAKELGVDGVLLIDPKTFNDKEAAQAIRELMGGAPEVTIECSGVESSVCLAIFATKSGGKVAIVGLGANCRIPLSSAAMREIDLIGVCRIKDDYQLAIELISSGKLDVKPLISHRFRIEEAVEAFNLLKSGAEGVVKVLIQY